MRCGCFIVKLSERYNTICNFPLIFYNEYDQYLNILFLPDCGSQKVIHASQSHKHEAKYVIARRRNAVDPHEKVKDDKCNSW